MVVENEVRILTKNFIDGYTSIVSSHGGTLTNLYNSDNDAYWTNDDQHNFSHWDTVEMTLDFTFKVGIVETEFKTDSVILVNNNLRDFDLYYWNAGTWAHFLSVTENEDKNLYLNFGAHTTSRIRLVMKTTMLPNERKRIGQLIIARGRMNLGRNYSVYDVSNREKVSSMTLGDGSEHRAVTRFTQYRTQKYGCRATFDYLSLFDYQNLIALKNEGEPFLWYPESDFKPDEIYLVSWVNPFASSYTMQNKATGWSVTMELREV